MNRTSLKYTKKDGLEIKIGKKIIPLEIVAVPVVITIQEPPIPPTLKMELYLDHLSIDDIEAIAEYVRIK